MTNTDHKNPVQVRVQVRRAYKFRAYPTCPQEGRAKAGINRSILDVGWAQFASILTGKAESAGRRVILVNPAGTSITCHACGQRCERPRQDTVICPDCGPHDADVNGARNIYARAGLGSGRAAAAA